MRILKTLAFTVLIAIGVGTPFATYAAYESGNKIVTALHIDGGSVYVKLDPEPTVCQGGSYFGWGHLRLTLSAANADDFYAMLLAAYVAGEPIYGILYTGTSCSDTGVPEITGLGLHKQ